jgi:hypothetical protein
LAVKDLLLDKYKSLDIAKIRTLFSGPTINLFIKTPLTATVYIYKLVWDEERNGCFSVKSGYNLVMRHITFRGPKFHVEDNWNDIWKAQVPHKARHLLWC